MSRTLAAGVLCELERLGGPLGAVAEHHALELVNMVHESFEPEVALGGPSLCEPEVLVCLPCVSHYS